MESAKSSLPKNRYRSEGGLEIVHPLGKDTNPYTIQGIINELNLVHSQNSNNGTSFSQTVSDTDSVYGHTQDVQDRSNLSRRSTDA